MGLTFNDEDPPEKLRILYQDAYLVAIHKPAGLLVHRTALAPDQEVAMILLRNQLGRHVWPLHRLDRATSGVLLFGLSETSAAAFSEVLRSGQVEKTYVALARGWCDDEGLVDHPLQMAKDRPFKEARSHFRTLAKGALPYPVGRYAEARYSLVEVRPETGRYHQIRKHFHHLSHHLIGDTVYGDGRHNQLFRESLNLPGLWLLAKGIRLKHVFTGELLEIQTDWEPRWLELFGKFASQEWDRLAALDLST